jgi:hypothetical protein
MNLNRNLHLSTCGDTLAFRYSYPFGDPILSYTILGKQNAQETADKIFAIQKQHGQAPVLTMVPEETVAWLDESKVHIIEDRDNFDYIYSCAQWRNPTGRSFRSLRTSINSIKDTYKSIELVEVDLNDTDKVMQMVNQMHTWKSFDSLNDVTRVSIEPLAINNCLINAAVLHHKCSVLYLDGRMASIFIYHYPPHKNYVIFNHLKCDYTIPNIFDFTFYYTVKHQIPDTVEFFNAEQDLGINGLRQHKLLMQPVKFLKRYTVKPL